MKNTFITFSVLFFFYTKNSFAQINSSGFDSISKSFYSRIVAIGTSLDAGKFPSRIIQNFEVGKTFGPLDIGIGVGRFSSSDSTNFAQLRTTLDATQIGVFSCEFALGIGKVFNSSNPLMFETSTTILAQFSEKIGVGAIVGSYDFIGEYQQKRKNFFGLFVRYGPMRNEFGGLIGIATRNVGRRRIGRR